MYWQDFSNFLREESLRDPWSGIFLQKYLANSRKSSTFAPDFEQKQLNEEWQNEITVPREWENSRSGSACCVWRRLWSDAYAESLGPRSAARCRSGRDLSECPAACLSSHRLFQVPLSAEASPEGIEAETGTSGGEGDTFRTPDRRARLPVQAQARHRVPQRGQQGARLRFLPWP